MRKRNFRSNNFMTLLRFFSHFGWFFGPLVVAKQELFNNNRWRTLIVPFLTRQQWLLEGPKRASRRCDVMTAATSYIPTHASLPFTCPYSTYLITGQILRGKLGGRSKKNPIITKILGHYVITQLGHKIFSSRNMSVYYLHLVWRIKGKRSGHREPII